MRHTKFQTCSFKTLNKKFNRTLDLKSHYKIIVLIFKFADLKANKQGFTLLLPKLIFKINRDFNRAFRGFL